MCLGRPNREDGAASIYGKLRIRRWPGRESKRVRGWCVAGEGLPDDRSVL